MKKILILQRNSTLPLIKITVVYLLWMVCGQSRAAANPYPQPVNGPMCGWGNAYWVGQYSLTIPSFNFSSSNLHTGPDKIFYTDPKVISINYRCVDKPDSTTTKVPSLYADKNQFLNMQNLLLKAGLRLFLLVTDVSGKVTEWAPGADGQPNSIPLDKSYITDTRPGPDHYGFNTISVRMRLKQISEMKGPLKIDFPSHQGILRLSPDAYGSGKGLIIKTSPFHLQYIPTCIGKVSITPTSIYLGHFLTARLQDSLPQAIKTITITAQQNPACETGMAGFFALDLYTQFSTSSPLTDSGRAILLKNDAGEQTGLKLSITEQTSKKKVFFDNRKTSFGSIQQGWPLIKRTYTTDVSPTGGDLHTGKFSADVVIKITYE
ncbi:hypothetical protein NAK51_002889 [Salmonella enterica]|nr:hypothetical protein [Salmonella enterica]EHW9861111.1 hypothetical protein [Salmonella enterica subsp. enterica serovar Poona]EBI1924842.1 hypothetical protein [Salmonella enterica]EHM1731241.1 hypothetical protein [Salmonella enterica]EHO1656881.1 hypothetical protein [Salmonella enterica]